MSVNNFLTFFAVAAEDVAPPSPKTSPRQKPKTPHTVAEYLASPSPKPPNTVAEDLAPPEDFTPQPVGRPCPNSQKDPYQKKRSRIVRKFAR
jgi:hypothetical protein